MNKLSLLIPLVACFSTGCAFDATSDSEAIGSDAAAITSTEESVVLDLVNDPAVNLHVLTAEAGLAATPARAILAYRAGADGIYPSADDHPFHSLAELDAVKNIGPVTIGHLRTYATAYPSATAETIEGVRFEGWEARAIVWGVNHATVTELDSNAGLDVRAAKSLVKGAPFANLSSIGPVSYVGSVTLTRLKTHAAVWRSAMGAAQ